MKRVAVARKSRSRTFITAINSCSMVCADEECQKYPTTSVSNVRDAKNTEHATTTRKRVCRLHPSWPTRRQLHPTPLATVVLPATPPIGAG